MQATGANQPLYRAATAAFNNKPTVQFDGSNDYLTVDVADVGQAYKLVAVAQALSTGAQARILGDGDNATHGLGHNASTQYILNMNVALAGGTADTGVHVYRATVSGASSQLWVDEVSIVGPGDAGAHSLKHFTLGAGFNGVATFASFWPGHIAYAAVYPGTGGGAVSDASLITLVTALQTHYGI